MLSLNVLVVGEGISVSKIRSSKYLNKLYITSEKEVSDCLNIRFNTFQELAQKCKSLQIDIVLVEDEKYILQGIADVLKINYVNCIAVTSKWTDLELNSDFAEVLLKKYNFDLPKKLLVPLEFPVIVKTKNFIKKANSIQEVIDIKQDIYNYSQELAQSVKLEEFVDGNKEIITSIYDGKNLVTFPNANIPPVILNKYHEKLLNMLTSEQADFTGFINSNVILKSEKLYNIGFSFEYRDLPENVDILYLVNSAVYQKLNELTL